MLSETKHKIFSWRVGATKLVKNWFNVNVKYVVWSQVKVFWARWRDKILPRQRAQKNDCFFFVASKAKAFAVLPIFGGTSKDKIDDQYKFILQKMKVSYDHYETLLHNFATNSVRQVLAKFLHLSLKELWT